MRTAIRVALDRRYADLVRLAYLVLDDGRESPEVLLATAGRAVAAAARRAPARADRSAEPSPDRLPEPSPDPSPEPYAELRRALLAVLAEDGPRRRRSRRRPAGRPASVPRGPVHAALRELTVHGRMVYLLFRLEGLPAPDVASELDDHVILNAFDVDETAADIDDTTGLGAAEQLAALRAFDPTLVRLRPPADRRLARRLVAGGILLALPAAGLAAYEDRRREGGRPGDPVVVEGESWRRDAYPALARWPSQGARRHDRPLIRRAANAWRGTRRDPPLGRVSVLYAGDIDGSTVVIMHDSPGFRDSPLIAQYFERERSRNVESIRKLGGDSGQLILISATFRYLVPPWRSGLEVALPREGRPSWRPVAVRGDGVTEALPWDWFDPECQNYVVLRMEHRAAAAPQRVTVLTSHGPEAATPMVWFRNPRTGGDDISLDGSPPQWAAVRSVVCEGAASLFESNDLRIARLWHGTLPAGGGRATMLAIDGVITGNGSGVAVLIGDDGLLLAERGAANSDQSTRFDRLAGAVWWRSERWYLVAVAREGVSGLETVGQLGTHRARREPGVLLLIRKGPVVRQGTVAVGRPPVVQVIAYESDGDRTIISP